MAERNFDLEQAEKLLPQLERWLQTVTQTKKKIVEIEEERATLSERISRTGGQLIDIAYYRRRNEEQERQKAELLGAAQAIEDSGCLLKDLSLGLVDFPCELEGQEFYLCWKLGETRIEFWHNTHEGFAGRKPIDPQMIERLNKSRPV